MPHPLLPISPDAATPIIHLICLLREATQCPSFFPVQPVFPHADHDRPSFRMLTAQLCCQDACTQTQIVRSFAASNNTDLRSVANYRQEEIQRFYRPRRGRSASASPAPVLVNGSWPTSDCLPATRPLFKAARRRFYKTFPAAGYFARCRTSPRTDAHLPLETLPGPSGYYMTLQVILLWAYMALFKAARRHFYKAARRRFYKRSSNFSTMRRENSAS